MTLRFLGEVIKEGRENKSTGKKGRPRIYYAGAILCMLMIKAVYHLPLRAARGFLLSLIVLLTFKGCLFFVMPALAGALKSLDRNLKKLSRKHPTDIAFDSS
ncbi:transposase [Neochlamydia sp. EPS4]|uniref:transposase n=1 Tax=Neochlamydia sp. EPS4 TaxID=1478175 RepID=UPI0009B5D3AB